MYSKCLGTMAAGFLKRLLCKEPTFAELTVAEAIKQVKIYREKLFRHNPKVPDRTLQYNDDANVPQEMQFAIDCLPTIQQVLKHYPRDKTVSFLDYGPGNAAGTNLIATLHSSDFLWCKIAIDAMDHIDIRQDLARFTFPLVNYLVMELEDVPVDMKWDVIYCSNVVEHFENPVPVIEKLVQMARDWLIIYAPYKENPLSSDHKISLDESLLEPFRPVEIKIINSLAWQPPSLNPKQILALLKGQG